MVMHNKLFARSCKFYLQDARVGHSAKTVRKHVASVLLSNRVIMSMGRVWMAVSGATKECSAKQVQSIPKSQKCVEIDMKINSLLCISITVYI